MLAFTQYLNFFKPFSVYINHIFEYYSFYIFIHITDKIVREHKSNKWQFSRLIAVIFFSVAYQNLLGLLIIINHAITHINILELYRILKSSHSFGHNNLFTCKVKLRGFILFNATLRVEENSSASGAPQFFFQWIFSFFPNSSSF